MLQWLLQKVLCLATEVSGHLQHPQEDKTNVCAIGLHLPSTGDVPTGESKGFQMREPSMTIII